MWNGIVAQALTEGRITAEFQPIVDLSSRVTVGHEALARLCIDNRCFLPGEWLPHLSPEVMRVLSLRMISLAVGSLEDGAEDWVSINLDAITATPAHVGAIVEALHGVPVNRFVVELTERQDFSEVDLSPITHLGYRLSLDDFGTQHNNLAALLVRKVDFIKLDKSICGRVYDDTMAASIAHMVLALASSHGITTIGEGITSERQAEWLLGNGCQLGQGFLFPSK